MKASDLGMVLRGLSGVAILLVTGCGPSQSVNPFALRKENTQLKTALRQYQDQLSQTKQRADNLDQDNEQLHNELALQQESLRRAREEQSKFAMQTPRPPAQPRDDYYDDEKAYGPPKGRAAGPASKRQETLTSISRRDSSPTASMSGAEVIRDGDAVRIRVTNGSLFDPGKATLKPGASKVLDQVASVLKRNYSGQLVGIEGHTDADPIRKSNWKDNHELSYQRARAVYEYLSSKGGIPSDQLYVAAFGSNMPIASNSSASGKAQNRRVEFVIQPSDARASADRGGRR